MKQRRAYRRKITEKDIAKHIITSKEVGEIFIKAYMKRHKTTRKQGTQRLKELGVRMTHLRDKA